MIMPLVQGLGSPEMTLTSSIHFHILEYKSIRKWAISAFLIQMPMGPKLILPYIRSRSTQELVLYNCCSNTVSDATYQISRQLAQEFWKRSFKVLSIFSMAAILVMWLWPFDSHYFFHPKLDSYEMCYYLALLILRKWTPKFYHNFSIKVTLVKVSKCPWPLAFISDRLDFISIL